MDMRGFALILADDGAAERWHDPPRPSRSGRDRRPQRPDGSVFPQHHADATHSLSTSPHLLIGGQPEDVPVAAWHDGDGRPPLGFPASGRGRADARHPYRRPLGRRGRRRCETGTGPVGHRRGWRGGTLRQRFRNASTTVSNCSAGSWSTRQRPSCARRAREVHGRGLPPGGRPACQREQVRRTQAHQDFLVFPIVLCWPHPLELRLKAPTWPTCRSCSASQSSSTGRTADRPMGCEPTVARVGPSPDGPRADLDNAADLLGQL